jgi:mono/diheme cytochrome c family protein
MPQESLSGTGIALSVSWKEVSFLRTKAEGTMKMTINGLMKLGVAFAGVGLAASFVVVSVRAHASSDDFDAAGTYKAKCFACHGAKAEKKWDSTHPDDQLVESILKGKKAEKPPNMPGFEEKGITADQAKALVAYMKSIKE